MKHLFFTGSYGKTDSICLLELDSHTGKLRVLSSDSSIQNPSYVILNPERTRLYAVSEEDSAGSVSAFSVDPQGRLTWLNSLPTTGGASCHLALSWDQTCLAVSNYLSGTLDLFTLGNDGTLQEKTDTCQHRGRGPNPDRQEGPHAHFAAFLPGDSRRLLAVDLGTDRIFRYQIQDNRLISSGFISMPAGSGPRHLVFSRTHPELFYLVSELGNQVFTVQLSEDGGSILSSLPTMPEDFEGYSAAAAVRLSQDGKFLFASNRVYTPDRGLDCIASFPVDPETGLPGTPEFFPTGGKEPRDFDLMGDYLVTACQSGNRIQAFPLDGGTIGACTGEVELRKPCCIAKL